MTEKKVDFGSDAVSPDEKTRRVHGVFSTVADRYDLMNDLMSLGSHRLLKRVAVETTSLRPGQRVLDVASGTGDIARLLAPRIGRTGRVVALDVNADMLRLGRDKSIDAGFGWIEHVLADAERLPFDTDSFDAVTIGFGLRNVTNKDAVLHEIHRVLTADGRVVVLEFSQPEHPLLKSGLSIVQRTWPYLGQLVVGDATPYRYLVESIERHPTQATLKLMLEDSGFKAVKFANLLGGAVALHWGTR